LKVGTARCAVRTPQRGVPTIENDTTPGDGTAGQPRSIHGAVGQEAIPAVAAATGRAGLLRLFDLILPGYFEKLVSYEPAFGKNIVPTASAGFAKAQDQHLPGGSIGPPPPCLRHCADNGPWQQNRRSLNRFSTPAPVRARGGGRSADESWGGQRDLNPRQPDPQSGALTRLSYDHRPVHKLVFRAARVKHVTLKPARSNGLFPQDRFA